MFRFVLFFLQHRSHYKHQLPLCPPCRATEGNGNRQGRNEGLPKRSHTAPSPLKQTSGAVWFLRSQTGGSRTRQMLPTHQPHLPLPLDLDSPSPWPSRQPKSKVNTAATHQTRFKSPVSMLNGKSS